MKSFLSRVRAFFGSFGARTGRGWRWYRSQRRWKQIVIAAIAAVVVIGGIALARGKSGSTDTDQQRTVTLSSVASLSGGGTDTSVIGTVRSITEADLLAQTGGTVKGVYTSIGKTVPAGAIIAELDNSSEAAAVLQAEGAYDAAVAARDITSQQSGNAQTSLAEAATSARTTYRSSYTTLDTTLQSNVDTFFGGPTAYGPQLLIAPGNLPYDQLSRERQALDTKMQAWQQSLSSADSRDPLVLLDQATGVAQAISDFLVELARAANVNDSHATATQLAALASARSTVDAQLASLSAARDTYNAKKTSASVAGSANSQSGTQLASANASVKSALGALRGAQANLEKTRIRATIGGTVNFLSIHVGDYVTAFTHVATVAQNGALEIVAYVSEDQRDALTVGQKVSVEGGFDGVVTTIAPALDPNTKQIEVHIAVDGSSKLVNGQSVRITVPSENPLASAETASSTASSTPASTSVLLPLSAVKLLPESRAVFTVGSDGRLVAHSVTIGDVVGDRILVTSGVTPDMVIVTDARGLAEGQKVSVATSTPAQQ
jgi:RND family efflux transporter MFP subunit